MQFWFLVILFGSLPLMAVLALSIVWINGLIRKFRQSDKAESLVRDLSGDSSEPAKKEALNGFHLLTTKLQAEVIRVLIKKSEEDKEAARKAIHAPDVDRMFSVARSELRSDKCSYPRNYRSSHAFRTLLSHPNRDWLKSLPTKILLTLSKLEDVTKVWTDVIHSRMTEDEEYETRTEVTSCTVLDYQDIREIAKDELVRRDIC